MLGQAPILLVVLLGAACGGRTSSLGGTSESSGALSSGAIASGGSSQASAGIADSASGSTTESGSGSVPDGGGDATVTGEPLEGASVVDADATSHDAAIGACCGQPEPNCAPGVCCVASDCASSERCLDHVCQSVRCAAADQGVYYVDPSAGTDDSSSTGASNCPFRSVTHTLSVIVVPDAGAGVTIKIVNNSFAPILGVATGEVLPIRPPANVTIVAQDATSNWPTFVLSVAPDAGPNDAVTGFLLTNRGDNLSHLVVDSRLVPPAWGTGIFLEGAGGSIDHVIVQNMGQGIDIEGTVATPGFATIGPGVISRNSSIGLFVIGFSVADIKGGLGIDHTSFTGNQTGISVRDLGGITVEGADVDPSRPDESDVDVDDNTGSGLVVGAQGIPAQASTVVRGLHASGNSNGIEVAPCATFNPKDHLSPRR